VDYDRLVKLAGVPRIRIHELRHTRITLAIQQGAPIKLVSEEAGHSHVSITLGTYAHVLPAQRSEIADRLGALLFTPRAEEALRP
jgi:integrase